MKPNPLEWERVLAILEWLGVKARQFCTLRVEPASVIRAVRTRRQGGGWTGFGGKKPEDAYSDGVADILAVRIAPECQCGCRAIALECKRPGQKQRPSQIAFQARWEKAGGRYHVVHGPDEVERIMLETLIG